MGKVITIACLAFLLLGSNAWHVYRAMDQAATMKYLDLENYELRKANGEFSMVVKYFVVGKSVEEMKAVLSQSLEGSDPFVKEGHINDGLLSFKLDQSNSFVESVGYDPDT